MVLHNRMNASLDNGESIRDDIRRVKHFLNLAREGDIAAISQLITNENLKNVCSCFIMRFTLVGLKL